MTITKNNGGNSVIEQFKLKSRSIDGIYYDNLDKRQAIIEFLGDAFNSELTGNDIIHFTDSRGKNNIILYGEYLMKHPILGFSVLSPSIFEAMYERANPRIQLVDTGKKDNVANIFSKN